MSLGWSAGRGKASRCGRNPTSSPGHGQVWLLASPIPGVGSGCSGRRISRVPLPFPMACPWSLFSLRSLTVPCPASSPQLIPWIVPPTAGRTPGCKVLHLSKPGVTHGSCSSLTCGQSTAHSGDAVQPPPAASWRTCPRGGQLTVSDPLWHMQCCGNGLCHI